MPVEMSHRHPYPSTHQKWVRRASKSLKVTKRGAEPLSARRALPESTTQNSLGHWILPHPSPLNSWALNQWLTLPTSSLGDLLHQSTIETSSQLEGSNSNLEQHGQLNVLRTPGTIFLRERTWKGMHSLSPIDSLKLTIHSKLLDSSAGLRPWNVSTNMSVKNVRESARQMNTGAPRTEVLKHHAKHLWYTRGLLWDDKEDLLSTTAQYSLSAQPLPDIPVEESHNVALMKPWGTTHTYLRLTAQLMSTALKIF